MSTMPIVVHIPRLVLASLLALSFVSLSCRKRLHDGVDFRRSSAVGRPVATVPTSAGIDAADLLPQYTDEEALEFAKIVRTVVPKGQQIPRYRILRAMNIDERRMRGREVQGMMSAIAEIWQLSEHFDLTLWSDARAYRDTPIEDYVRLVYGVTVEPGMRTPPR